ncbi:HIV Tat-specific factor 1-like [Helianthus annuus]|uniref:HIV Tat-specific factor 1-like n=1 Tax=Helianthus annuus TaxID=4232 RepID=UPI00165311CD|nr:HIV Tat-specific factor 1-like [Helianthus annuus]
MLMSWLMSLKKVAEKEKVEDVKEEEAVTKKQENEDDLKKKEEDGVKLERSVKADDAEEQQEKEVAQTQTAEKAEVPITEKGIGSEYHQVPPPFEEKFTFYDDEKVEKTFNMVDQLPDNIDVTYSKSDDSSDSEVVEKAVESVLKEESVLQQMVECQKKQRSSLAQEEAASPCN